MTATKTKKKSAKKAAAARPLSEADKAYIVAQLSGLVGKPCAARAKELAFEYGVSKPWIYGLTRHVRPNRRTRVDKCSLRLDIETLLARTDKTLDDFDTLVGILKTELDGKGLTPEQHARLAEQLRRTLKDQDDLIRRQARDRDTQRLRDSLVDAEPEDEEPSAMEEFWRGYWREWVLDSPRNLAVLLGWEVVRIHKKMLAHVEANPDKSLTLSFRGSGKSTILTVVRAIHLLLSNHDIRICIVSDTSHQARALLFEISTILMTNEDLIWLFGSFFDTKNKWTETKIAISQRKKIFREGTIEAYGLDTAVVGGHFDVMIYDDIVSEENSRTERQRERLLTKFRKKFKPCLMPDGAEHFNGTRYHFSDMYFTLMQDTLRDSTLVIPAIDTKNGSERSAWPQLFPIKRLRELRRELGTMIFNSQYQNDTEAMKGSIFKYEWMEFCNRDEVPKDLRIFQGVDLAISTRNTADYFAHVTVGLDVKKKTLYVLDSYHARISFRQQKATIVRKFQQFDAVKVAIEANAYQAVMAQEIRELGGVRVRAVVTHKDKVTRAMKLSARFEDGKIIIVKGQETLVNELLSFPGADHDDLFDALELAISSGRGGGPMIY